MTFAGTPTLTVAQEVLLYAGLQALDGHTIVPKTNGQEQAAANVAYDFSGDVRWKIRDNLVALQPKMDAWDKVKKDDLKFLTNGTMFIAPTDSKLMSAYQQKVSDDSSVVDPNPPKLQSFTRADLNMNVNPIPGSVLDWLAPILP